MSLLVHATLSEPPKYKRLTNKEVLIGTPVPPIDKLKVISDEEFEVVVSEWAKGYLTSKYEEVYQLGGAGDKGRDVVAYKDFKKNKADYFQCKHYSKKLGVADVSS